MKRLQILMPMGGLGTRFSNNGFNVPKPLIEVDGIPMFLKALTGFDDLKCKKTYIFVIRQEQVLNYQLDKQILKKIPEAKIVIINKNTEGAVETCLKAENKINLNEAIVIIDCDLYFKSKAYNEIIENSLNNKLPDEVKAAVLYFKSNNPRYSYAEIENGYVTKTAEKKIISNNALTGAYFFNTGKIFINAAKNLLKENISKEMPEYYLSLLYNYILKKKHKVLSAKVDKYYSFGTPEELNSYKNITI